MPAFEVGDGALCNSVRRVTSPCLRAVFITPLDAAYVYDCTAMSAPAAIDRRHPSQAAAGACVECSHPTPPPPPMCVCPHKPGTQNIPLPASALAARLP